VKKSKPSFDAATAVAVSGLSALAGHELYRQYVGRRFPDGGDGHTFFTYIGGGCGGCGGSD